MKRFFKRWISGPETGVEKREGGRGERSREGRAREELEWGGDEES